MKKLILGTLSVAALLGSTAANAVVFSDTFDIYATDFTVYFGSGIVPPEADPVHLNFSLTFDDSLTYTAETAGFTINSFNLPYALTFSYAPGQTLVIATVGTPFICTHVAFSFCAFIADPTGTPNAYFVEQSPSEGGWSAATIVLNGPPLPEPASWAMMIGGLAAVGATMRRKAISVSFA